MMIELKKEYYIRRSDGWDWFGDRRWWNIHVIIDGYNGGGGFWLREIWRQNSSLENVREEIKSLSYDESLKIIDSIEKMEQKLL